MNKNHKEWHAHLHKYEKIEDIEKQQELLIENAAVALVMLKRGVDSHIANGGRVRRVRAAQEALSVRPPLRYCLRILKK